MELLYGLEIFIKEYLSGSRLKHTISTAQFVKEHSHLFKIDPNKAYIASILHDIAKEVDRVEMVDLVKSFVSRNIIQITELDFKFKYPSLLHGPAAAEIAYKRLNITDIDILSAIVNHTTGGEGLSDLSKFLFVADFCEPQRKLKESKEVRTIIVNEKKLIKAYNRTYFYLINHLLNKNAEICMDSIRGFNESINNLNNC